MNLPFAFQASSAKVPHPSPHLLACPSGNSFVPESINLCRASLADAIRQQNGDCVIVELSSPRTIRSLRRSPQSAAKLTIGMF